MIRAVIFDLDGTLIHSLPGLATALNQVLKTNGFPTHSEAAVRNFIGDGIHKLVQRGCPTGILDDQIETITQEMVKAYALAWRDGSPPFPRILETLETLKKQHIKLAIFSNKPDGFCQDFAEHFFPDTFEVVTGQRHGVPVKPDPTGALEVANRLGIPVEETAFVGDSTMDVATAINANMVAIAVTWGYHDQPRLEAENPDHVIHNIDELVPLLNKI